MKIKRYIITGLLAFILTLWVIGLFVHYDLTQKMILFIISLPTILMAYKI